MTPTTGRTEVHGYIGSLLEVGTGFHPDLTGRENIYMNGTILGIKRSEIRRRFDEIVVFSEIEKFIDTPVKWYSSGMYLRLAYSVAVHLDTEVLIMDEVVAVGDVPFQMKCLDKMNDIRNQGRTILFVSHSMAAVTRLRERVIFLDKGGGRGGRTGTTSRQ
jgi:lipopolysaccharide transport system ATP-binding protein